MREGSLAGRNATRGGIARHLLAAIEGLWDPTGERVLMTDEEQVELLRLECAMTEHMPIRCLVMTDDDSTIGHHVEAITTCRRCGDRLDEPKSD